MGSGWFRTGFVYLLILVAVAALIFSISPQSKKPEGIPITQLAEEIKAGKVERITVTGDDSLKIEYRNTKETAVSHKESGVGVIEILRDLGVSSEQLAVINIEYEPPSNWASWLTILGSVLPVLVLGALFYFLIRQAQSRSIQALREAGIKGFYPVDLVQEQLVILCGLYGTEGKYYNVTQRLNSRMSGGRLKGIASNDYLLDGADPIKGVEKELVAVYYHAGQIGLRTFPENEGISLPPE